MQIIENTYAACSGFTDCINGIGVPGLDSKFQTNGLVGQIISSFLPAFIIIAGFLSAIFIVISGIQFINSGGNPEAAGGAKNRLTYAIVGFIICILSFAILQVVDYFFLNSKVV